MGTKLGASPSPTQGLRPRPTAFGPDPPPSTPTGPDPPALTRPDPPALTRPDPPVPRSHLGAPNLARFNRPGPQTMLVDRRAGRAWGG
jgi:hypothetical protein